MKILLSSRDISYDLFQESISKISESKKDNFDLIIEEFNKDFGLNPFFDPVLNWEVIVGVLDLALGIYLLKADLSKRKQKKPEDTTLKKEGEKIINIFSDYLEHIGEDVRNYKVNKVNNLNGFLDDSPTGCYVELIELNTNQMLVISISYFGKVNIEKKR